MCVIELQAIWTELGIKLLRTFSKVNRYSPKKQRSIITLLDETQIHSAPTSKSQENLERGQLT